MSEQKFQQVAETERRLMKQLHDSGDGVGKIAKKLGRSKDTVYKHVFATNAKKATVKKGRPTAYCRTPKGFLAMKRVYDRLLRQSQGKSEVTPQMVKERGGFNCCAKTISRAFWERGIYFRPQYKKPDLSNADRKERKLRGSANSHRTAAGWNNYVHAIIDNKVFQVYTSGKFRDVAARRKVRGTYRTRRRVFTVGHVKPPDSRQSTGAKSIMVTCAVGAGKMLMWHEVQGRWNGAAAANMYRGPLRRALEKAHPGVRGLWRVMEDNDPAGYKSGRGKAAKADVGIQAFSLPKRSPDLNPLDFSFWAAVNTKMREQEKYWPKSRRETRTQFLARLRRTATKMPSQYITRIIGALERRCQQVLKARGGHFAEGGLA